MPTGVRRSVDARRMALAVQELSSLAALSPPSISRARAIRRHAFLKGASPRRVAGRVNHDTRARSRSTGAPARRATESATALARLTARGRPGAVDEMGTLLYPVAVVTGPRGERRSKSR